MNEEEMYLRFECLELAVTNNKYASTEKQMEIATKYYEFCQGQPKNKAVTLEIVK